MGRLIKESLYHSGEPRSSEEIDEHFNHGVDIIIIKSKFEETIKRLKTEINLLEKQNKGLKKKIKELKNRTFRAWE